MADISQSSLSRRAVLIFGGAGLLAACGGTTEAEPAAPVMFDVDPDTVDWQALSEEEWRSRLSDAAFRVLRREDTERAFTSPLHDEKRPGIYHCAGCDLALFDAAKKFDSGTGWPSFWDHLPGALATKPDNKLWMQRTESHCVRCGGHQGHVFNDGPAPTGQRWCNNGVALTFRPSTA